MPKAELMLTLTRLTVARDLPVGHLHVATCQFTRIANSSLSNQLGIPAAGGHATPTPTHRKKIKLANIDTINKIGTKLKLMLFPSRGIYAWKVC